MLKAQPVATVCGDMSLVTSTFKVRILRERLATKQHNQSAVFTGDYSVLVRLISLVADM